MVEKTNVYLDNLDFENAGIELDNLKRFANDLSTKMAFQLINQLEAEILIRQDFFRESQPYLKKAISLSKELGDTSSMLNQSYNLGYTFYGLRDYDSALYYYFKVMPFCEKEVNRNCRNVFNQIGSIYSELQQFDKAKYYLNLTHKESLKAGDSLVAANALLNTAGIYFFSNKPDSCILLINDAVEIYERINSQENIVNCLNNLALVYDQMGDIQSSLQTVKRSLASAKKYNDRTNISSAYTQLVGLYTRIGNFRLAHAYGDSTLELSKSIRSKFRIEAAYDMLFKLAQEEQNFKKAVELLQLKEAYSDSLLNEVRTKQMAELETKYESEKKGREILLLNQEKQIQAAQLERNRFLLVAAAILVLLVLLIAIILFKQKDLKERAKLETERSKLKSAQIEAVISSQEKERKRFAMDLHDGFGQLISALKLNVASLTTTEAKKSERILDSMYISLKNIAFDLMPHTLFEKGLEEAIEELMEQVNSSGSLKMTFQSFGVSGKINDEQKIAVYRITQELVSNIIKYAGASKINISLTDVGAGFSLLIEDDGAGYNLETFKNSNGNGWKNIHSRLDLLDGEIDFDTVAGRKNSTVSIEIPYKVQVKSAIA